jgi:PAS domain S-box-containing protein
MAREAKLRPEAAAAWLAAIVDSSDDAIVSKALDGTVTSWNLGAEGLFGYAAGEVIGRPISILAVPGRENEMRAILERIRRGEKIRHYETVRRRKDGTPIDISLTVSPILDRAGRVVGASKIARDISERKRAEAARREGEERFRTLANTVPDIVWTAGPDGTVTFANDRWLHFCGTTPEENVGAWPELVIHPDDRERCVERWSRALQEGSTYDIELRHRRFDGEYRWFLTRAVPMRDGEGRIMTWFGTTTDIHLP